MKSSQRANAIMADELWRRSELDESQLALTIEQLRDLDRRIEDDDLGLSDPRDWEEVRDELRRQ